MKAEHLEKSQIAKAALSYHEREVTRLRERLGKMSETSFWDADKHKRDGLNRLIRENEIRVETLRLCLA